jgi:hypothetical protein
MSRRTHTLVLAGIAAFATLSLTACGGSLDGSAHAVAPAASTASATVTASATPSATPAPTPAPIAAAAAPAPAASGRGAVTGGGGAPAPAPAGGGSNGAGGGGSNNGGGGGGGNTAPAPKITKFVISKQPSCPVHGTPDAPFSSPGNDVTISWSVAGADGAAIAVDNPGTYAAYGTYGSSGSLTLPFGCTDGTTTTHTYTVWPAGAKNVSKTISASAHSDN